MHRLIYAGSPDMAIVADNRSSKADRAGH